MPKRTLITWAISIVFVTLAYFNVNWNNHPKFVDFLMNQWVAGGVVLGLVGLVLRRWVLRADWEFWSTPLWALAFSMLGARILHHEIPNSSRLNAYMFGWWIALLGFLTVVLWAESFCVLARRVASRVPARTLWIGFYLLNLILVVGCLLYQFTWFEGQRFEDLSWPLALIFVTWPLVTSLRWYRSRLEPQFARTLFLLSIATLCYWTGPDTLYFKWHGRHNASVILLLGHFVLTGWLAWAWERLRDRESRHRWALPLFAFVGWCVSGFFNGLGNVWLLQSAVLAFFWAWEDRFERDWRSGFQALLAFGVLFLNYKWNLSSLPGWLLLTGIVTYLRSQGLGRGTATLRTFLLLGLLFLVMPSTDDYHGAFYGKGPMMTVLVLLAGAFLCFWWEGFRERSRARWAAVGVFLFLGWLGFLGARWDGFLPFGAMALVGLVLTAGDLGLVLKARQGRAASAPWVEKIRLRYEGLLQKPWMRWAEKGNVRTAALGLLVLCVVGFGVRWMYRHSVVTVVAFTPGGEVSSRNVRLAVQLSDPVEAKGDLTAAFQIEPPLSGSARLEDPKTLVFEPTAHLKPATKYKARFESRVLKSSAKWAIQTSASTEFHTPPFTVLDCNVFFAQDTIFNREREMIAELTFSYPVDPAAIASKLSVKRDGVSVPFRMEMGATPRRVYVRAEAPPRQEKAQSMLLRIEGDLTSAEGGSPLGKPYENGLQVPAKPEFYVDSVRLHHKPGASMMAILFTLPVDEERLRAALTIDPPLPVKIETEYRYAVLSAAFKPNVNYKVSIAKGMKAATGETLKETYERELTLEDAPPFVRFGDVGRLVPLRGPGTLAISTMNLDRFDVGVQKVFKNNLVPFLRERNAYYRSYGEGEDEEGYTVEGGMPYNVGVPIWNGSVTVQGGQINEPVESVLTLRKWQQEPWKGLFVVDLSGPENGGRDSRWFLATDLGLMVKRANDHLFVQVLSLSDVKPLTGVTLRLMSDNNQTIQTVVTDGQGRAKFEGWNANPYKFRPFLVMAEKGDDWSFLRLDQGPLNASRFDIGGFPVQSKGWDGFLTSERGLYRPGETAHITGVVRHADLKNAAGLPVRLKVFDVTGSEVGKLPGKLDEEGIAVFDIPLPETAATGQVGVNLELENGEFLCHTSFKVEEFIPHKIKVAVEGKPSETFGTLAYLVKVNHLFGPPATKLKVRSTVRLAAGDFHPKGWDGWRFADETRDFPGESLQPKDATTDEEGKVEIELKVPESVKPASMMKAIVYAECFDTGGRPVGANATLDVHRYDVYLGLKAPKGNIVDESKPVTIGVAAVTPKGALAKAEKQTFVIKRRIWYSIFHQYGWSSRGYESSYYDELVEGKTLDVVGKGQVVFTPKKPGQYTVYLGTEEGARTSLSLTVEGPGSAPLQRVAAEGLDQPEVLNLQLEYKRYSVGQKPKVTVRAPFAGTLVIALERETLLWSKSVPVRAGLNVVELPPVVAEWTPNVYVTGLLVRPPTEAQRKLPRMSFGVAPLTLDGGARRIATTFKMPKEVESRSGIAVTLETGVPDARVVLSAVDEGILRIIGFGTPDPFGWFYRKRSLTTSTWSLFTDVLPELSRRQAVGGASDDAMANGLASRAARHLNPISVKRVRSYAHYEGHLKADKKGQVRFRFPTKGFHGQVRVMAIAVKGDKFGSGATDVRVADPLVLEPSFPRFLAPGDAFDLPLLLSNQTKSPMETRVTWSAKGPIENTGEKAHALRLPAKGQEQVLFHGKAAEEAGKAVVTVSAVDGKKRSWDSTVELAVRPPNPLTTLVEFGELGAGKGVTLSVPGGFIKEGQKTRLSASASPLLPFLGAMDHLIGYPYGCAEQTTSKAFPLLYLRDLGLVTGRFSDRARAVEFYVQEAVDKLVGLQHENGTFSYWPNQGAWDGGNPRDNYLANYCSHFLLEAKRLGYDVPERVLQRVRDRLGAIQVNGQNTGRLDRRQENVEVIDATYVLYLRALVGAPDLESMKALRDKGRKDALLSLAFSQVGDVSSAKLVLPNQQVPSGLVRRLSGDWFSTTKYGAEYLLALASCTPDSVDIPVLSKEFGKDLRSDGSLGSTHDNAWGLMALAKAVSVHPKFQPLSAEWGIVGGAMKPLTGETAVVSERSLSGRKIALRNTGASPLYYHLMAEGTRLESKKEAVSNGLRVSRVYRDEEGKPINLGAVTQGQLIVVTLNVEALGSLDNVVIVDLLPAGFEVDNPRLSSRGSLGFEPDHSLEPAYRDFRDDRVLLFTGEIAGTETFSYSVRAVTPGTYTVPALLAEAMYDPDIRARSASDGTLVVAPLKY